MGEKKCFPGEPLSVVFDDIFIEVLKFHKPLLLAQNNFWLAPALGIIQHPV